MYEKIYKRKRNKKESENEKRGNEIEEKKRLRLVLKTFIEVIGVIGNLHKINKIIVSNIYN